VNEHDWKFDWLRNVMRGVWVAPSEYSRVKGTLLKAFDEQDMRDRLAKLKQTEPEIFVGGMDSPEARHADDIQAVMKESRVKSVFHATLRSILRWHTSRESMLATVEKLRTKNAVDWFRRR